MSDSHASNDDLAARIEDLELQLREMRATLDFIKDTIVKADTTISKVAEEVMPTLNGLLDSPMLKMLMPKEKRGK